MTNSEKYSIQFIQLVGMLHAASMQQMGKTKNPMTDKIEKNLDEASATIDILDMIQNKTKGNLSSEEEKYLTLLLQELKLNFVDEKQK
ncbi:MAG: DUF1844 domain-containing protein [Bacteroidota bacterium]